MAHDGVTCLCAAQAKRVNIGVALITNPRILFLDEPTSGLDSQTANEARAAPSFTHTGHAFHHIMLSSYTSHAPTKRW